MNVQTHPFQVDFDAPLGYKEPERPTQHHEEPAVSFQNEINNTISILTLTFPPN